MTTGQINAICWTIFIAMCVLFAPALLLAISLHSVLLAVAFVVLWWAPFGYGMYIALAVWRKGDRRLLKRGIEGTAAVLSAKATNTVVQEGEFAWEAPRVYKYELLVDVPGKKPYETSCRICASGISEGQTVKVAVARHNHKRVTIDVGQSLPAGRRVPVTLPVSSGHVSGYSSRVSGYTAAGAGRDASPTDGERLGALAKLGRLHEQGVLTDTEFASQKARILSE
jgi:hypothetical protein